MPENTSPVLEYQKEKYNIQMLESLNIPEGQELFCTESDLCLEEICAINEYARELGLISKADSLLHIQICAINDASKLLFGIVSSGMVFYVKEGYADSDPQLANFVLTEKCSSGRDHTEWLASGIVTDDKDSEYLFLLHKILLSHGIIRNIHK